MEKKDDAKINIRSEITRNEYLRLLSAARTLKKERTYLLIKLFACTGVRINQLSILTAETVREGRIGCNSSVIRIPSVLQEEILNYAKRKGRLDGAIFCTRNGHELDRSNLTHEIQSLAPAAQVSAEKCCPRCLRRLYVETQAGIRRSIETLVEQASDRILEEEQTAIGWK